MDLNKILASKPHNPHYLKKYISFINNCIKYNAPNETYTENHHICPKSKDMFPEYKCLKTNPWNKATLTYRQHIIAHVFLWKTFNNLSQTLSVIRTIGQYHTQDLKIKSINSKLIESIKKDLSNKRKGVFTRGYNLDGTPNVSEETKLKLSKLKTEFYKDPKNRKAQSKACTGTTGRVSDKYKIASENRSESHKSKLKTSIKKAWELKSLNNDTKRIKDGVYITPFGNFTSLSYYGSYCRNNKKPFTIHNTKKNPRLNKSIIGKTPQELGFSFIFKSDPLFEQYCVGLNQAHQPEPNHPLLLELNDYLSHEKLHPE
jgi:hypothetical protein